MQRGERGAGQSSPADPFVLLMIGMRSNSANQSDTRLTLPVRRSEEWAAEIASGGPGSTVAIVPPP